MGLELVNGFEVRAKKYYWVLFIDHNFTFDFKAVLMLKSTIQDGQRRANDSVINTIIKHFPTSDTWCHLRPQLVSLGCLTIHILHWSYFGMFKEDYSYKYFRLYWPFQAFVCNRA